MTRVLGNPQTVEDYPRLTITDREVGTIHYDTSRTCIFLVVTAPDYPQRIAFKAQPTSKHAFRAHSASSCTSRRRAGSRR